MTPTIPALRPAEANPLTRLVYRIARRRFGEVPEPFAVAARHTGLLWTNLVHELALERATGAAPSALVQLAVYRTAWTVGCSWCVDFGAMLQRLDGLDTVRLREIDDFETSPAYTELERQVIRLSDAMTATPPAEATELLTPLRDRLGDRGALELVYQIAHENQRARMNHALGITGQGFSDGSACRVPWDASPQA
ncbi:carboxymuconolactone decarboxylase family protein [Aeromicrobium sp. YIM 150415]|uniref:carboxymuconolactone decarboxylase family protein n=1 Tax=Aeromicrobium sp. YIM 150415 TaxID=2803912 RepID=UPI001962482E|nr:carboxymuconolactone decarboxylase family protein [Aeromicrobium sp. YIM 150415]MBM9462188.1 carboxymuconolactone decarboxylase family protein [Aeromicrobium sp. YIM 150415]